MKPLSIITDIGLDHDDEMALALAVGLSRAGLLKIESVVANLAPPKLRAQLAKGALKALGVEVPVGVGTDCKNPHLTRDYEFQANYLSSPEEVREDGHQLLVDSLTGTAQELLLISGFTDAATLMEKEPELVKRQVEAITLMGGVEVSEDNRSWRPDSANNNQFDIEAAEYLYAKAIELKIPTTVVSRQAAYASFITPQFYEELAATAHPVATRVSKLQKDSTDGFWKAANLPPGHPDRGTMAERCTREWFLTHHCNSQESERSGQESIWPEVKRLHLYDPVALLTITHPQLFIPHQLNDRRFQTIGLDAERPGVKTGSQIVSVMAKYLKLAFQNSMAQG